MVDATAKLRRGTEETITRVVARFSLSRRQKIPAIGASIRLTRRRGTKHRAHGT
jgi:hypothetical protein